MDEDAEQIGGFLFEVSFQFGGNIVYTGEWHFVRKSAMAGNIEAPANAFDLNIVHVKNLGEGAGNCLQAFFQGSVAHHLVAALNGGRLALDVGEDGGNFRHVVAHLRFQLGDAV